jgi:hypothetical protein
MKFHLRVYDNFHYADESEAYNFGEFDTYEEALLGAQSIVDEFLEHNWKSGITADELIVKFLQFGDDPIIVPNPEEVERFSARTYANQVCESICKNKQ